MGFLRILNAQSIDLRLCEDKRDLMAHIAKIGLFQKVDNLQNLIKICLNT